MKTLYLAGKMSGLPELNYPLFNAETARLRELGYTVHNPAENPVPSCGSWAGYMRMAISQVVQADAVVTLDGWLSSRGAQLEVRIAKDLGMTVLRAGDVVSGPAV